MAPLFDALSSQALSRRTVLKLFGFGAVGGAVGYSRFSKPQPAVHNVDSLDLPYHLARPRKVVIVGGGLAGLAAAYELSQRGMEVTLLERSPQFGGKIASWSIDVAGEPMRMEHGFHGFFPQYYNLFSLVDELQIQQNFKSLEFYSVVYREHYQPEVFRPSHSAFPWNIVDLAVASPNRLKWGINLVNIKHLEVFREITGFRSPQSFQRLDHLSVADWVRGGFPQGLYDLYFLPFAKSSLNAPDRLSAGELMQFFHFYFFGNPEGLAFNGTCQDMGRSLVDPLVKAIADRGGRVIPEATVNRLHWQDHQIAGITYQTGSSVPQVPFWVERNPLLSNEEMTYWGAGDRLYALAPGSNRALSLTCTHQGCTVQGAVQADQAAGIYQCPCHGAAYDQEGHVLAGPAKTDLPQFKVLERREDAVRLVALPTRSQATKAPITEEFLQADYYILAADIPGIKHLFSLSDGEVDATLLTQVDQLAVADPFAVARFWFDQDFLWEHSNFTSLSGYRLTDSITLYHRIQDDYIAWAQRTGGSVVELHAYCYKETEFPTQVDLLQTFETELYEIVPSLREATLLHRQLVNQKNFAGFPPNSYAERPESATSTANLMFAGDWVKMPFPCGLMERAISSGLLAANRVLQQEGIRQRPLLSVNPEGILKI